MLVEPVGQPLPAHLQLDGLHLMATTLPHPLLLALHELVSTTVRLPVGRGAEARVVALALEHLGVDHASITVRARDGSLGTLACSDRLVERVERLQETLGEGPMLSSPDDAADVVVPDLAGDRRWPRWSRSAAEVGVLGVITVRLGPIASAPAVLNLYSTTPGVLTDDLLELARVYADEVSVALRVVIEVQHLHRAIDHRTVIGQAEGLLMERYQIDADRAFEVLKRISSQTNQKLHAVAVDVVLTRRLSGLSDRALSEATAQT